MLKKALKKAVIIALIGFIGIQFYRPSKNQADYSVVSTFEKETKVTDEIRGILQQNCYNCHSNHTVYPWYTEITPMSLWINNSIAEGKKRLNFSAWDSYSLKKKDHKMEEIIKEVRKGRMPVEIYTVLHGKLSDQGMESIINWGKAYRSNL